MPEALVIPVEPVPAPPSAVPAHAVEPVEIAVDPRPAPATRPPSKWMLLALANEGREAQAALAKVAARERARPAAPAKAEARRLAAEKWMGAAEKTGPAPL